MRFITFLKKYQDSEDDVGDFARWVLYSKRRMPLSSSIYFWEIFLEGRLTEKQWDGFYKAYLLYANAPGNLAPKELKNVERIVRRVRSKRR